MKTERIETLTKVAENRKWRFRSIKKKKKSKKKIKSKKNSVQLGTHSKTFDETLDFKRQKKTR